MSDETTDRIDAEKMERESHHKQAVQQWTSGLIKCNDCDSYIIYKFVGNDVVTIHSCVNGKKARTALTQAQQERDEARREVERLRGQMDEVRRKGKTLVVELMKREDCKLSDALGDSFTEFCVAVAQSGGPL
jgi:hypothetical protein